MGVRSNIGINGPAVPPHCGAFRFVTEVTGTGRTRMDAIIGKLKEGLQRKRDLDKAIARSENENAPGLQAQVNRLSEDMLHSKPSKAQQSIMQEMRAGSLVGEQYDEEDLLSVVLHFRQSKAGRRSQEQWGQMDKLLKALAESEDPHDLDAHSPPSNRRDDLYEELARTKRSNVDLYGQLHEAAMRTLVRQFAEQMNLPTDTAKQMRRRQGAVNGAANAFVSGKVKGQLEEAGIDKSDIMDVEIAHSVSAR